MIDRKLLTEYIDRFFGYGNLEAKYWFVGLEEGGDDDPASVQKRLELWNASGRPAVIDLQRMMRALDGIDWFGLHAPLQRTWRALIRARFAAQGQRPALDEIKRYQREVLGRSEGDTALLELLPLPARGRRPDELWPYAVLGIPSLASRNEYRTEYEERRRKGLLELIDANRPRAVVTYGDARAWRDRLSVHEPVNAKAWVGQRGRTVIICTHHPEAARANAHWQLIGETIARRVTIA